MLKKVRIAIKTIQNQTNEALFEEGQESAAADAASEEQVLEFSADGSYYDDGTRISIAYREGAQTGMDNTRTTISFFKNDPQSITLTRDGAVSCALRFEAGALYSCPYQTPYMPFLLATKTKSVQNRIEENGTLCLEYTAQLKGAEAQHTVFVLCVHVDTKQ